MATRRKEKPLKGAGNDTVDHRELMHEQILAGRANRLVATTLPDGVQQVFQQRFVPDAGGSVLVDNLAGGTIRGRIDTQMVVVQLRRLTRLEYDDPLGD